MTPLGWIFLGVSLTLVWSLAIWCFARVLAANGEPPDPVKDFHSA